MKALIFDSGPIISMAMNNLLWLLKKLKAEFKGDFYITPAVKEEVVDRPLNSKRFKYEAMQVMKELKEGTISVYNNEQLRNKTLDLLTMANNIFFVENNNMKIVQYAEMEVLAACILSNSNAIVIDERTTRLLVENPDGIKNILENKLHSKVFVKKENLEKFSALVKGIKVIRSLELVIIAYEKGFFNEYIPNIKNPGKNLLDGLLWGVKLNGCSVTADEIEKIIAMEGN
jgi:hypothetical protein